MLQLKEKDFLVSAGRDNTLRIWSLVTYQRISVISKVECVDTGGMMEIKGNRVIVGGPEMITVVDIGRLRIEKNYTEDLLGRLYSVCYLHGNEYVFSERRGNFVFYAEEANKITCKIEKAHTFLYLIYYE